MRHSPDRWLCVALCSDVKRDFRTTISKFATDDAQKRLSLPACAMCAESVPNTTIRRHARLLDLLLDDLFARAGMLVDTLKFLLEAQYLLVVQILQVHQARARTLHSAEQL